jgi:pseudouridine-5'-phosphate glycosidase
MHELRELIKIAPEVAEALAGKRPVVALESSIITHGMPYPTNLDLALAVEAVVRQHGATPATIAVAEGTICVGLGEDLLRRLAAGGDVSKASRRDLAALVATGATAGTTVSATMLVAARCGIAIFATGGIGGVHRGAAETFDISADLTELGRTPVAVVCSGAKSILDLGKTLEVLETQGVPVLGYRTEAFPAFFSRESSHRVDRRFDSSRALAEVIDAQWRLGLKNGILIANPIPEADALPAEEIEAHIAAACREADAAGVSRKDLTPYLLARINELTKGQSLKANTALVKSNAALAADISVEYTRAW